MNETILDRNETIKTLANKTKAEMKTIKKRQCETKRHRTRQDMI